MNEYDSISLTGTIQIPDVTRVVSKLEKDVSGLRAMVDEARADVLALRAQVAHEMAVGQILRLYIEYLNPAEGKRPRDPMSYAEWLKMQAVNEQILAARAAA